MQKILIILAAVLSITSIGLGYMNRTKLLTAKNGIAAVTSDRDAAVKKAAAAAAELKAAQEKIASATKDVDKVSTQISELQSRLSKATSDQADLQKQLTQKDGDMAQLKTDLWNMGDPYSSQDCDYDWADEAGHIRYGQAWLKALFPDLPKSEIIRRTQHEVEQWKEWIAETHRSGRHGYHEFLPRIETKCARMPQLAHPEHFQALGSSAATRSYA